MSHIRLPSHGVRTPYHKNKTNSSGGSEDSEGRDSHGPLISAPSRYDEPLFSVASYRKHYPMRTINVMKHR